MFVVFALAFLGIFTFICEIFSFLSFLPYAQFWLLGYFGYIWTFIVAFILYQTKEIPNLTSQLFLEKILGVVIMIFALLVLQGLFFRNVGILGAAFNSVLEPFITSLGIFGLSLLMFGFGIVLYTEKSPKKLYFTALSALKDDLHRDLKQVKTSKDALYKNKEKLKILWLKTKAFFALPSKKDSIGSLAEMESKMDSTVESIQNQQEAQEGLQEFSQAARNEEVGDNEELRPLTLEELIEQSKNNPPPKEQVFFNFDHDEEEQLQSSADPLESKNFEDGIDVLRQDIELPMRENHPSVEISEAQEKQDLTIRLINAKSIQHDSFDPAQFQMRSIASLENLKRFETNNFYSGEEEQKEEPIKLIKREDVIQIEPAKDSVDEFAQTHQVHFQKELPKKSIKSYPKKLYAATPFSAYYDKEPVGTHDRLVDMENIHREYPSKSETSTLPKTIFYYGDTVSTHPLPKNVEPENAVLQSQEAPQEKIAEDVEAQKNLESMNSIVPEIAKTSEEIVEALEKVEPKIEIHHTSETIAQEEQDSLQIINKSKPQEIVEQPTEQTLQYVKIPSAIPTFDYGYRHYQDPMYSTQQVKQMQLNLEQAPTMQSLVIESESKQVQNLQQTMQQPKELEKSDPKIVHLAQMPQEQSVEQDFMQQQTKEVLISQSQNTEIPILQSQSSAHTIVKTLEENAEALDNLEMAQAPQMLENKDYELPKLEFLQEPKSTHIEIDESEIDRKINDLLNKMRVFKIEGDIVRTYSGPIVTTFEFRPSPNVKVSRILTLQDDLAMALRAKTIRIQAPIPGKDVVGIEIPNAQVETIYLREILENDLFKHSASPLTLALGKDIVGNPFVTDLKKLPHLLIAGTTGSGKSVGINAMILSLLYKNSPDKLKLIMVDPKMVEFSIYNDIPHLLTPVITNPKNAIFALDVAVKEMEHRNALISEARVKNIDSYNQKAEIEGFEPFPYIVIIIDELADLMMTGGKEAEASISRLTQMARSSGIHLIVATQRPSVDVVTGLIKANLPSRISYKVGQKIDSKVILDCHGAESLLGNGDMLFAMGGGNVTRLHAPFSTENEIERIVEFIKAQRPPQYDERFLQKEERTQVQSSGEADDLYEEAKRIMLADGKTSISYIQRRLGIGFNKAANIVEQMQQRGFLSKENSKGVREIIGE